MKLKHEFSIDLATGHSRTTKKWRNRHWLWSELVERCSKTQRTNETAAEYARMNREEQSNVKDVGGFVGGYLSQGVRKNANVLYRSVATLDIDYGTLNVWEDFTCAFNFKAAAGGIMGYAFATVIRKGMARGVFSNEAGLGSSVIAHSASEVREPVKQGLWGVFEVFFDTFIICTLSALMMLTTLDLNALTGAENDTETAILVFSQNFSGFGIVVFTIILPMFAFTTILAWSYYGEKATEFVFQKLGVKGQKIAADVVEIKPPGNKSADLLGISFYDLAFGIAVRLARKGIVVDEILSGVPQIHTKRFVARRVELFFGSDAVLIND